jgi:hypothetical protein
MNRLITFYLLFFLIIEKKVKFIHHFRVDLEFFKK